MKQFPKKYKPRDLRNLAKTYRNSTLNNTDNKDIIYSPNFLPTSKKLSYQDFYLIYLKDFFNYKEKIENYRKTDSKELLHEQLFFVHFSFLQ